MEPQGRLIQGIMFGNVPNEPLDYARYRLHRVLGKTPVSGTILTRDVIGTYVHYFARSTYPCTGEGCEACITNTRRDWHGYLGFCFSNSNNCVVLDILPNVALTLSEIVKRGESLRGLRIKVHRDNGKDNGRQVLSIARDRHDGFDLPQEFDVLSVLLKVWRVKVAPRDCWPSEGDVAANAPRTPRERAYPDSSVTSEVRGLAPISTILENGLSHKQDSIPGQINLFPGAE